MSYPTKTALKLIAWLLVPLVVVIAGSAWFALDPAFRTAPKSVAEMPKAEYHARHILVDDEAKAKDLIAQIDKGASFEKLAKENSSDGSAAEGGDLGWFSTGQMVKPFSDAVQQLEVGKYTATPVKSEFGWHVIKLEETRPTTPPPYDAVKAQLGPLVKQKQFEAHLKELVGKAKVERAL